MRNRIIVNVTDEFEKVGIACNGLTLETFFQQRSISSVYFIIGLNVRFEKGAEFRDDEVIYQVMVRCFVGIFFNSFFF